MTDFISHDDADLCLAILMGGTSYGWDEASVAVYRDTFTAWTDARALAEACRTVITNHTRPEKPPIGTIKATHDAIKRRAQPDRALPSADNAQAYRDAYHREAPGDIFGLPDPDAIPATTENDIADAWAIVLSGRARYPDVMQALGTSHPRARGALRALEKAGKLEWRNNGSLIPVTDGSGAESAA
jgi:hypothetical protein